MRNPGAFATAGRLSLPIALVAMAVACHGEGRVGYTEPPASSYRQAAHRLTFGEATASVTGTTVSPEFFSIAGVQPFVGRLFVEGDYQSSSDAVVVLSHQLWTQRFDSSPAIIGREVVIDERRRRVVGVMPPGFTFPEPAQLWMPKPNAPAS